MAHSEKQQLYMMINQASFAMDDARLFLDTHPQCSEAMEYFEQMEEVRKKAMKQYTKMYGPINEYDVNENNCWTWNEGPWPWEVGGC